MGHWIRVESDEDRERYLELLQNSNQFYARSSRSGLNRLLGDRSGRAYIYSETEPVSFGLLLLLAPPRTDEETWKIVNAMPIGNYDCDQVARITLNKARQLLDELGVAQIYGRPLKDYGDPELNRFFRVVRDLCWELVAEEETENERTYELRFERPPERRHEDQLNPTPS